MKKAKDWPPTKKEQQEMLDLLRQLSPENLIELQKQNAAMFVDLLSEGKSPEQLIEVRNRILSPRPFPPPAVMAAELKKKFHEKLIERKSSPFKAIKGGRRQKRITPTLKGGFHL
jgi:hypothetical protein